jgi:alkylated DNA repair dioxygenase AlkB
MPRAKETPANELPEGFRYQREFLTGEEESQLLRVIETLPFTSFEFGEYTAKRRIVVYGWDYDFGSRRASETDPIPEWLWPLRTKAAEFASVAAEKLVEAVVTEYPAGAPIGWHRDVPQFEDVVGVSLRGDCRMRFKPHRAEGKITSITLEPRSVYLLRGPVRWKFQHSIPAVKQLRYSITFRTLR